MKEWKTIECSYGSEDRSLGSFSFWWLCWVAVSGPTSPTQSFKCHSHSRELPLSLCVGRGVKVETILKDDETLTSFLLRDVPLTQSVVYQLVNAQIRPEQVHRHTHKHTHLRDRVECLRVQCVALFQHDIWDMCVVPETQPVQTRLPPCASLDPTFYLSRYSCYQF